MSAQNYHSLLSGSRKGPASLCVPLCTSHTSRINGSYKGPPPAATDRCWWGQVQAANLSRSGAHSQNGLGAAGPCAAGAGMRFRPLHLCPKWRGCHRRGALRLFCSPDRCTCTAQASLGNSSIALTNDALSQGWVASLQGRCCLAMAAYSLHMPTHDKGTLRRRRTHHSRRCARSHCAPLLHHQVTPA